LSGTGGNQEPSEALLALRAALDDGKWHDGPAVMREVQRAIPPGLASRARLSELRGAGAEEMVTQGRRKIARTTINAEIARRKIEVDPVGLTRAHWSGELPWRLRDPLAGALSVTAVAEMFELNPSTLRVWIAKGYVPVSANAGGVMRLTPDQVEITRRVHEVWPGPNARHWPVDPRSVWEPATPEGATCPHCGETITVMLGKG
jgi:MerR HTH family regulatory protein